MSRLRSVALAGAFSLAPSIAFAQLGWGQPGYNEGYDRGQRAGVEDSRRGNTFEFRDESDYRRGDLGYRSPFGNRDRYRDSFRLGFQDGYRSGFGVRPGAPGRGGFPPWLDGRGRGYGRYDLAYQTGLNDGYEAGLDDARDRRRYDPISERRFRNGDRGYQRQYGPRELYENNYRAAFKLGYERGYADGRRYGGRPGGGGFFGFGFRF